MTSETHKTWFRLTAVVCSALLVPGDIRSQQTPPAQPAGTPETAPAKKTPDQLDSLVAPLALYPDPLLAQVLAASTYPLEIVQCRRWLQQNSALKGEELTKAAQKQPWDPSVQALVAFPDALKLLDENLQWTTDLGDAFLEDQGGVMDAVQRMRKKAKDGGKLESSKEQKVEVTTVEQKTVIEIKPADPQVIYVPSYNPTVVYGPPVYAYPPVVYPPPPPTAYWATAAISFGVGVAMGAMWSGCCHGGYGWGCSWGSTNINANININNNFNTRYGYNNINNIQGGNRVNNIGSGNSSWQHNPSHRKSVPYSSQNTAQRFGGSSRTDGGLNRGGQNRAGQGRDAQAGTRDLGGGRSGAQAGTRDLGGGRSGAQAGTRDLGGGQDRVGNRSVQSHDRSGSAFGGGESRARAETSSNRGHSSARSSSSFGGGGGGRSYGGGGGRGGGGRRR